MPIEWTASTKLTVAAVNRASRSGCGDRGIDARGSPRREPRYHTAGRGGLAILTAAATLTGAVGWQEYDWDTANRQEISCIAPNQEQIDNGGLNPLWLVIYILTRVIGILSARLYIRSYTPGYEHTPHIEDQGIDSNRREMRDMGTQTEQPQGQRRRIEVRSVWIARYGRCWHVAATCRGLRGAGDGLREFRPCQLCETAGAVGTPATATTG